MTTHALVYPRAGDVVLQRHPDAAPGPGQLACVARLSLVSTGTELACLRGEFDDRTNWSEWVRYPFAPGYSMVAEVVDVGEGVTGFQPGDRICSPTPHTSRPIVDAREAVLLDEELADEHGVWASLAVTTQWALRRARVEFGERVAVVGAGLLGQLLVRYLSIAGAREVVVIDPVDTHLARAMAGGATEAIASPVHDLIATHTGRFDVVFDVTGHPSSFGPSSELLRPLGRLVLVGDNPRPSTQSLGPRIVADGITVVGVHSGTTTARPSAADPWSVEAMLGVYFDFVRDGRMDPLPLITDRVDAAESPDLYRSLLADRAGRLGILLDWSSLV